MWMFVVAAPVPYVANQAGWVATEVGRQPWVVYRLLRTSDAVSRSVPGEQVLGSIVLFGLIYIALVALWLVVMNEKIKHGPDEPVLEAPEKTSGRELAEVAARLSSPDSPHSLTGAQEEKEVPK
jgi:cytochrome d ubiquinol oxidase subunit I